MCFYTTAIVSPYLSGSFTKVFEQVGSNHAVRNARRELTAVSEKTIPALSKTCQDFGFFFDVNQTVTRASDPFLSNKGGNNEQKLQNLMLAGASRFFFTLGI